MEFNSIDEVLEGFEHKQTVAINEYGATDEEIEQLSAILEEHTKARPFDGTSYYTYMMRYRESYPLMVCDSAGKVSSYIRSSGGHREHITTVREALALANNKPSYTESDFESVF